MKRSRKIFLQIFVLVFILSITSWKQVAAVGDQVSSERFLAENKYFIQFVNIAVTNFGEDAQVKLFKESGNHDFWAQVSYLQSKYKRTYREIRKSQEIMVNLFSQIMDIYLLDTKKILDRIAPTIIRSKDSQAKHYLTLGYRDLTEAKSQQIVALHSPKVLFSYKIKKYMEGIKLCRRAKRYSILAILHAKTPADQKIGIDKLSYEEIGSKLIKLQESKDQEVLPEFKMILHHVDNKGLTLKKETVGDILTKEFQVRGLDANFSSEEKINLTEVKGKQDSK